jgi:hypothetical protein
MKECIRCRTVKESSEFYSDKRALDGLGSTCKCCIHLRAKELRLLNPEPRRKSERKYRANNRERENARSIKYNREHPEKRRAIARKHLYGLSQARFSEILETQLGMCPICGAHLKSPHVDHCHSISAVRGLLCGNCNRVLGIFKDSIGRFLSAALYLERHK